MEHAPHPKSRHKPSLIDLNFDLRSLALLRIALGLIILGDLLVQRWPWLHAHYAGGLIGLESITAEALRYQWHWSVLPLSNSPLWVHALFLIQAVAALALTLGWRTWIIVPLNWALACSVQTANPFIIDGGDALLRLLLLFGAFLPLGARWSVDARIQNFDTKLTTLSDRFKPAAACLTIQLFSIYWFSLYHKAEPMWMERFDTLHYAFQYVLYAKPLARELLAYPTLIKSMTGFALAWEALGPVLILLSWRRSKLRMATVGIFLSFHIMIFLTMGIEVLSLTCIAAWLAFIPGEAWGRSRICIENMDTALHSKRAKTVAPFAQAFCVILLLFTLYVNSAGAMGIRSYELPSPWKQIVGTLRLGQNWTPFARQAVLGRHSWVSFEGRVDSSQPWINLQTGAPASNEQPENARELFPNERWRRGVLSLLSSRNAATWPQLCNWYAAQWNAQAAPDDQVAQVRMVFYFDYTEPPGQAPVTEVNTYIVYGHTSDASQEPE